MDNELLNLVHAIHKTPQKAVVYATGGGLQAVTWLLTVPGASNTILDARVPYAVASLVDLLGQRPEQAASPETALNLAKQAYKDAAFLAPFGSPIVGLACTCALASDRIKKGDHKVFVATHDGAHSNMYSIKLAKGERDRLGEDNVASRLLVRALAEASGLAQQGQSLSLHLLDEGNSAEVFQKEESSLGDPLEALYNKEISTVEFCGNQIVTDAPRRNRIYLPGSYNPLHKGHRKMLEAACDQKGDLTLGCYELSIGNPDKGFMPIDECRKRIKQFVDANLPVLITKAPLYSDKAKLCPGSTFVIGYDTAIRLIMPKYYGGYNAMLLDLHGIKQLGCKLLVAGRVGDESKFLTLEDVDLPEEIITMDLFEGIPEDQFRLDISSTELRNAGNGLS